MSHLSQPRLTSSLPSPDPFRARLCRTLVDDVLREVECELLAAKSVRFLAHFPWVPGKRLRPITFLSIAVEKTPAPSVNGRESRLAAAIELLHEASLVHDDLVDRSTVRRGKPTMQMINGDGLALLIGDYMVFRGMKLVLDAALTREDILLAQELANTGLSIAQGEVDQLDLYLNKRDWGHRMSMTAYLDVIAKKTAAFFAGCAEAGAALAGATPAMRETYRSFGTHMGLAFQMVDDLMDVAGDAEKALKTLKNNLNEGTVTLPMIHAHEMFPDNAQLAKLSRGDRLNRPEQTRLHRVLATDGVLERSRHTLDEQVEKAKDVLSAMPANIYRAGLDDLLDYVRHGSWGGLEERLSRVQEATNV
jgi:octaprenyl-diphosphate synthase